MRSHDVGTVMRIPVAGPVPSVSARKIHPFSRPARISRLHPAPGRAHWPRQPDYRPSSPQPRPHRDD